MLTGTYSRSLDDKLRVTVPKQLREALESGSRGPFYIAPGTDGSLSVYRGDGLARLAERLDEASPAGQDVRAFVRLFYSRAQSVEIDSQGRIRIPPELAALAAVTREVVLIGVQDHLEIWDADRWRQYVAGLQDRYDQIAEAAFSNRPAAKSHN